MFFHSLDFLAPANLSALRNSQVRSELVLVEGC
jgi:hypothetical protein